MLVWIALAAAAVIWLFRRRIRARLEQLLPDRATRHRIAGTIIAAFVLVFAARLLIRWLWGS